MHWNTWHIVECNRYLFSYYFSFLAADYIIWRALLSLSDEGPKELVDARFKFIGTLQGTDSPPPRYYGAYHVFHVNRNVNIILLDRKLYYAVKYINRSFNMNTPILQLTTYQ